MINEIRTLDLSKIDNEVQYRNILVKLGTEKL